MFPQLNGVYLHYLLDMAFLFQIPYPQASVLLTKPLVETTISQTMQGSVSLDKIIAAKSNIRQTNRLREILLANTLDTKLGEAESKLLILAEKTSSSWQGFLLNKGEFRDELHLGYGWEVTNTPEMCACRKSDHALICMKGSFPTLGHNQIRNVTASLLTEVCHNVAIEPPLQHLSVEQFSCRSANTSPKAALT